MRSARVAIFMRWAWIWRPVTPLPRLMGRPPPFTSSLQGQNGDGKSHSCLKTRHVQNPSIEAARQARYSQPSSHQRGYSMSNQPGFWLATRPLSLIALLLGLTPQIVFAADCTYREDALVIPAISVTMASRALCVRIRSAISRARARASPGAPIPWVTSKGVMAPLTVKTRWAMCAAATSKPVSE